MEHREKLATATAAASVSPIFVPPPFYSPSSSSSPTSQSPPSSHSPTYNSHPSSSSLPSPNNPPPNSAPSPPVVVSPCAACKILRRRCVDKCVLAPYFPPTEPYKFTIAHRVFGASNIIKFLQDLPESQRADAVSSMVYEANARIRDPVYGCAGAICQLQKQVSELQVQLAKAQAELVNMQCQQANLVALICMEMTQSDQGPVLEQQQQYHHHHHHHEHLDTTCFLDDNNLGTSWDALWT